MTTRQGPHIAAGLVAIIANNEPPVADFGAAPDRARDIATGELLKVGTSVARIRPMLDSVVSSLGFESVAAPVGLPANCELRYSESYHLVVLLVDSLSGIAANGESAVASAGFTVYRGEVHGLIVFTAPTSETVGAALGQLVEAPDERILERLRTLEPFGEAAQLVEVVQHELTHVEDLQAQRNFAMTLYAAKIWDLVDAGKLPRNFAPSDRPSREYVQAATLLSELHAFTQNQLSSPELSALADETIGKIGPALKIRDATDRCYAIFEALRPWYANIPASYDVGNQHALLLAALMVAEQEVFP